MNLLWSKFKAEELILFYTCHFEVTFHCLFAEALHCNDSFVANENALKCIIANVYKNYIEIVLFFNFFSWVISQAKKELIDEDIAKYDG